MKLMVRWSGFFDRDETRRLVDANLQVDGKFGSRIDFDTVDDNMSDPFWARVNLQENELKLNQGA